MTIAKLFMHGGRQAVRLPKAFSFSGREVVVEVQGDSVLLRPKPHPRFKSLGDVARYLASLRPNAEEFPARDQPPRQQKRGRTW